MESSGSSSIRSSSGNSGITQPTAEMNIEHYTYYYQNTVLSGIFAVRTRVQNIHSIAHTKNEDTHR